MRCLKKEDWPTSPCQQRENDRRNTRNNNSSKYIKSININSNYINSNCINSNYINIGADQSRKQEPLEHDSHTINAISRRHKRNASKPKHLVQLENQVT